MKQPLHLTLHRFNDSVAVGLIFSNPDMPAIPQIYFSVDEFEQLIHHGADIIADIKDVAVGQGLHGTRVMQLPDVGRGGWPDRQLDR